MKKKLPYLAVVVIAAFLAFFSGVTIDSAWADSHNANGVAKIATGLFALIAVIFIYLSAKTPKSN